MSVAFRKVWRDLWNNKGRTLLVVLSIAVGVMAIGMIITSNTLLGRQMTAAQQASHPSHVILGLRQRADDATIQAVARTPNVVEAEGAASAGIRWKPSLAADWQPAQLIMRGDYARQIFDLIELKTGAWPNARLIGVEASQAEPLAIPPVGALLYFEVNNHAKAVRVGGLVHDPQQNPPPFTDTPVFYVSRAMLAQLVGWSDYSEIRFSIPEYSDANARAAATAVEDKLLKTGIAAGVPFIQDPKRHPLQDIIDGVGWVLVVMAGVSLGLSTILVINTINAVIAQQIPQIGIMKTVGGLSSQIATLYLAGVSVYGLLSLLIAVPLGAVGGTALSRWMLYLVNVPVAPFEILAQSFLIQIGTGLFTPLLAALWPVLQGAAVSVREALSAYGVGAGQYGAGWLDQILGRVQNLPSLSVLALRNTFRRMGRVILTELTLILAGAVFMMVVSTNNSLQQTIAGIYRGFGYDMTLGFEQAQRIDKVIPLVAAQPGVLRAEMWIWRTGALRSATGPAKDFDVRVRAIPHDTQMFTPVLTAGRNLEAADGHALLLNQKLAADMGVTVGDRVILDLDEAGESTWQVVGLLFDISGRQSTAYVHVETFNIELNQIGRAGIMEIHSTAQTLQAQDDLAKRLKDYLDSQGLRVSFTSTALSDQEQSNAQFGILTTLLLIMTFLMAAVGELGLSGTLSINVLERRREIGVMRAVGASSSDVSFVFMGEGLLLGLVSWVTAIPISVVGGKYFLQGIGEAIKFPAVYYYSPHGVWIWLVVVITLSLLASWLPARRATQISVRESLAYE